MIAIPAGSFWMGSEDGSGAERPRHQVFLSDYRIDARPVTNAEFAAFVAATGHVTTAERCNPAAAGAAHSWRSFSTPARSSHPVVCVSWEDAVAYAAWLGKRLPTEAEWERAARGGIEGALYPWGDELPSAQLTNWEPAPDSGTLLPTAPVGHYPPNALGVFDMTGAVWQWCADWYAEDYYSSGASENPRGPLEGQYRVRRGGAFNVREAFRLRCANRGAMPPDQAWPNLGFRCAVSGPAAS
jgi:formylglycine-generating enzyme required for sulfatase activity